MKLIRVVSNVTAVDVVRFLVYYVLCYVRTRIDYSVPHEEKLNNTMNTAVGIVDGCGVGGVKWGYDNMEFIYKDSQSGISFPISLVHLIFKANLHVVGIPKAANN